MIGYPLIEKIQKMLIKEINSEKALDLDGISIEVFFYLIGCSCTLKVADVI